MLVWNKVRDIDRTSKNNGLCNAHPRTAKCAQEGENNMPPTPNATLYAAQNKERSTLCRNELRTLVCGLPFPFSCFRLLLRGKLGLGDRRIGQHWDAVLDAGLNAVDLAFERF
jgi:hypothetical protein